MKYISAKNIVTRTKSTAWFGTEYNMNIYKGCCHGCIYRDSRSDCYGIDKIFMSLNLTYEIQEKNDGNTHVIITHTVCKTRRLLCLNYAYQCTVK